MGEAVSFDRALTEGCLAICVEHNARVAAARAERERTGQSAIERVMERLGVAAPRSTAARVKSRASYFRRWPDELASISGLTARLPPQRIIDECWRQLGSLANQRWTGFGGEVPEINLRGAILYARWLRRVGAAAARHVSETA